MNSFYNLALSTFRSSARRDTNVDLESDSDLSTFSFFVFVCIVFIAMRQHNKRTYAHIHVHTKLVFVPSRVGRYILVQRYYGKRWKVVDDDNVCDDATATDAVVYKRPLTRQPRAIFSTKRLFMYRQRLGSDCAEGGRSAELGMRQTVFAAADVQLVHADERRVRFHVRAAVAPGKRYTIREHFRDAVYMHI